MNTFSRCSPAPTPSSPPHHLLNRFSIDLPVTSAAAWSEFTRPGALSWCTLITGSRYLTPPQRGIDTVRELSMRPSAIKAREHYFRWEEEPNILYRNTFYASAFTAPGLQRFAEDMLVEELATGRRLAWTFAIEPKLLQKPLTLGSTIITNALCRE